MNETEVVNMVCGFDGRVPLHELVRLAFRAGREHLEAHELDDALRAEAWDESQREGRVT